MSIDIYGGRNPLDMPLYTYAEASRYLKIPISTVRAWSVGRYYTYAGEKRFAKSLIDISGDRKLPLSFHNLVELDVLNSLRNVHEVSSNTVRVGLENAREELGTQRPLLSDNLHIFGRRLFTDQSGKLIELTNLAQAALEGVLRQVLHKVQRNEDKLPMKFFPDVDSAPIDQPIMINPKVSFGKPVLTNSGIRTSMIALRLNSGETNQEIANDYGIDIDEVTSAALYEYEHKRYKRAV